MHSENGAAATQHLPPRLGANERVVVEEGRLDDGDKEPGLHDIPIEESDSSLATRFRPTSTPKEFSTYLRSLSSHRIGT